MMTMISREAAIKMIESMTGDKSDVYSMAMADAADALRSLPAVDGVVVPREPTEEMLLAYRKAVETDLTTLFAQSGAYRYKAMIAAAPKGEA